MNIKPGSHIHLMGICGTAMASLAGLLKDRGFKITGSDSNPYPPMSTQLESLGISIQKGYRPENLHPSPDFVIVGNVISANNEEAQELVKLGLPYTSLPKAMGEFIIGDKECINISGTHGKTTTTSLMSWVAELCDQKPGFLVGGIPKNFSQSFRNAENSKYFIVEGDEYDTAYFDKVPKFIHYKPRHVILTSVEFDHADIYTDLSAVKAAFVKLIDLIPGDGTLIACADDANVVGLLKNSKCKKTYTYGINSGDFRAKILNETVDGIEFQVFFDGKVNGPYFVKMSGEYNILNATAVVALSYCLGFADDKIKKALRSFEGVKRRQDILGEPGGVLVIEDFAHHPTAVRETVKGIQKKYPNKKVFSIFEPRSATSRRKIFQREYVEAFKGSHQVMLAKAFDQSKITSEDRFSSEELAEDLKKSGVSAQAFDSSEAIVEALTHQAHRGDIVLIMSNGGFDGIYTKILKALEKH